MKRLYVLIAILLIRLSCCAEETKPAATEDVSNSHTYYVMGLKLRTQKQYRDSIEAFEKALALVTTEQQRSQRPAIDAPYVYLGMGITYLRMNDLDKASRYFNFALNTMAPMLEDLDFKATLYYNIGSVHQTSNRFKEALQSYDKALTFATSDEAKRLGVPDDIYYAIGTIHYSNGEFNAAMDNFRRAGKLNPFGEFFEIPLPAGDRERLDGRPLRPIPDNVS